MRIYPRTCFLKAKKKRIAKFAPSIWCLAPRKSRYARAFICFLWTSLFLTDAKPSLDILHVSPAGFYAHVWDRVVEKADGYVMAYRHKFPPCNFDRVIFKILTDKSYAHMYLNTTPLFPNVIRTKKKGKLQEKKKGEISYIFFFFF